MVELEKRGGVSDRMSDARSTKLAPVPTFFNTIEEPFDIHFVDASGQEIQPSGVP